MIAVGIIGGAGYVAGELLRLLAYHPKAQLMWVQSASQAGQSIASVHTDLEGCLDLYFVADPTSAVDVVFLCAGHGKAKALVENPVWNHAAKVIDLSQDHRYQHPDFTYGLPELNKTKIKQAKYIANPGCFATVIQLMLLPLMELQQVPAAIHIHAVTGATGAGQAPSATAHFPFRDNNVSIYKPFEHQHLYEIKASLNTAGKFVPALHFLPARGNFSRGIFATAYAEWSGDLDALEAQYQAFYGEAPFVHISHQVVHLKQVVNTNQCRIQLQHIDGKLLLTGVIDNLLKGAAGQAVQNMNLSLGCSETLGLNLKPSAF